MRGEKKENKKKRTSAKKSKCGGGPIFKMIEPLTCIEEEAVEKPKCDSRGEKTKSNKTEPKDQPQGKEILI